MRRFTILFAVSTSFVAACSGTTSGDANDHLGSSGGNGHGGDSVLPGGAFGSGGNGGVGSGGAAVSPAAGPPVSCVPGAPGAARIWKLSATQYSNTVATLIPNAGAPGDAFARLAPRDLFTNEAVLLSLPDTHAQELGAAAKDLGVKAVASRGQMLGCLTNGLADPNCITTFIRDWGKRAFRRQITQTEGDRYVGLYADLYKKQGPEAAFEGLVRLMLMAPGFIFRTELGTGMPVKNGVVTLNGYERASALSYFLVDGPPDAALMQAAETGHLDNKADVETQARRLLAGPESGRFLRKFFGEYLSLPDVLGQPKNVKQFPKFNDQVPADFLTESYSFIDHVMRNDGARLSTLLLADYSTVNTNLAGIYGIGPIAGSGFVKASMPKGQRAGLFTLGAFLSSHATDIETEIVQRGRFVRERLLCQAVPAPPMNVPPIPVADPNKTQRERLMAHVADPRCAGCHMSMDPLGLAFENYDALGQYRTSENGKAIDASGELRGTKSHDGPVKNAVELMTALASSQEAHDCLVQQLFQYAYGRALRTQDDCEVAQISHDFLAAKGDIGVLLLRIVTSDSFFSRTVN